MPYVVRHSFAIDTHIVQEWNLDTISMTKDSDGKSNLTFEGRKCA